MKWTRRTRRSVLKFQTRDFEQNVRPQFSKLRHKLSFQVFPLPGNPRSPSEAAEATAWPSETREAEDAEGDAALLAVLKIMRQIQLLSSFAAVDANAIRKTGSQLSVFSVDLSGVNWKQTFSFTFWVQFNLAKNRKRQRKKKKAHTHAHALLFRRSIVGEDTYVRARTQHPHACTHNLLQWTHWHKE